MAGDSNKGGVPGDGVTGGVCAAAGVKVAVGSEVETTDVERCGDATTDGKERHPASANPTKLQTIECVVLTVAARPLTVQE